MNKERRKKSKKCWVGGAYKENPALKVPVVVC
jgi:hypothetical protein